jgi:integrase
MHAKDSVRPTGHLQVKGSHGERAYYVLWRDAEGRHQRKLGPAWVKKSGKLTPRGAVKWLARDGTKPDGHLTPADAEDMLREVLATAPRRSTGRAKSSATAMTLREACDHWLHWVETDSEAKPSTLGDYRNVCDRMCRDLGAGTLIAAMTTERLEGWINGLRAERRLSVPEAKKRRAAGAQIRTRPDGTYVQITPASPRTKRKYLISLNGIMKRAMKHGAITTNPVALVDRPGRVHRRRTLATTQFLRPVDVHALVRAASETNRQDAVIFMVSAFCGLRLGELLDLRWGAINFDGSSIHVESSFVRNVKGTPKSGAGRTVPMAPEVARALAEHSTLGPVKSDADLVFVGRNGGHVDGNALRLRYYAALDRAKLKRIRIHDLRHTFGTVCAAKGIPQTTIKEWMGHTDLSTTEIYTAFYPQDADAAKISEAFAEESTAQFART